MKLSLDALKERAEAVASNDLLASISGGTENSCHGTAVQQAVQAKVDAEVHVAEHFAKQIERLVNWLGF